MNVRTRNARGFTILELVVVIAIGALVLSGTLEAFGGGHGLVKDTRARTKAKAEHRRNLVSLANVIRGADIRELKGFNEEGVAQWLYIRRVNGADLVGRTHDDPEIILWLPTQGTVPGVKYPGAVYTISSKGWHVLADRVPGSTFSCEQRGSVIVISLATYYRTADGITITTDGATAVQMRNWE